MNRRRPYYLILILCLLIPGTAYPLDIAVIVHPSNETTSISARELIRFFKREQQFWAENGKVYPIMQEAGSVEKDLFVDKVFKMNSNDLKKFWLSKIIKGEIASFPKTLSSNSAVKGFVSQIPEAIGYIDAALVDESVKVLAIDGKRHGEAGYYFSAP